MDERSVLDEVFHRTNAVHPAKAALLVAAFLGLVVDDRPIVEPDRARFEFSGNAQGTVDVRGPDRGSQSISGVVRKLDSLRFGLERLHDENRAEHLLLCDCHRMIRNFKERGPIEGPLGERAFLERAAAHDCLRTRRDRRLNELLDARNVLEIDHRTHLAGRIRCRSHLDGFEPCAEFFANRIDDRSLNEQPAAGHAELPGEDRQRLLDHG